MNLAPSIESKPRNDSSRMAYGDMMRILGAIAVVSIHTVASGANLFSPHHPGWWVYNGVNALCRWSVPVFIMLSGLLALSSTRDESLSSYYQKRFTRIGIPLLFWSLFYTIVQQPYLSPFKIIKAFVVSLLFSTATYHLYFLYILFGLYLLTPFFKIVTTYCPQRRFLRLLALIFLLSSGDAFLRSWVSTQSNALSLFLPFAGYFLLGYAVRDIRLSSRLRTWCWAALAISVLVTLLGSMILAGRTQNEAINTFFANYLSPNVIVMSLCVFLLIKSEDTRLATYKSSTKHIWQFLGNATFGVYLVHPFFLTLFSKYGLLVSPQAYLIYIPVTLALVLLASFITTFIIQKVPVLRITVG